MGLTDEGLDMMMIVGRGVSSQLCTDHRSRAIWFISMKRLAFVTMFAVCLGMGSQGFAQSRIGEVPSTQQSFSGAPRVGDLVNAPSGVGWGLLDPSRFRMRQSYSLSYMSGAAGSGSVGMYMNNIEYQLFKPLTLRVGLGYLHQPFGSRGANSAGLAVDDGFFIPSAGLEYRPSENFLLMVDFRQYPAGTAPYSRWGYGGWTPYGRSNLFDGW
jgi:hypothetical protein